MEELLRSNDLVYLSFVRHVLSGEGIDYLELDQHMAALDRLVLQQGLGDLAPGHTQLPRRLDQLGALTKGQRDTANQGLFSEKDNLESKYATQAVSQFFTDLQNGAIEQNEPYDVGDSVTWSNTAGDEASGEVISDEGGQFVKVKVTKVPQGYERYIGHEQRVVRAQIRGYEKRNRGINFTEFMQQMGLTGILDQATGKIPDTKMPPTRQFLNRMLSLKLDMQEKAFAAFIERMEQKIETAIERGELDTGMETIRALSSRVVDEETIYTDARTGAETKLVELELEHPTRYYDFPDAKLYGDRPIEWVVNRRSGKVWGRVKAGTNSTDAKGNVVERYRLFSTSGNKVKNASEPDMTPNGFEATYSKIDEAKARELWADENAKREPTYKDTTYLITGAVLPIWDRLKGGENSTLRVARTQTVDGRRWLGRVVEAKDIGEIRQRFNVKGPAAKLAPLDVMKRILAGEEAKLSNGWKLVRSRVADDLRIELKTPQALYGPARTELEGMGFFSERISWQDRHFLPTGPAGVEALTKLIASNKQIVDLAKPGDTKGQFSTGTAPATGIPQAALASLVARAQDRLRGVQIRIVESGDRLPAEAQKDQKVNRAVAWTDGNGTVYLVRNMIDSPKEAAEAIVHEVIGHEGVNAITSQEEWANMEASMWGWLDRDDLAPNIAAAVESVRRRYADVVSAGDRATFARELLAVMAEKGVQSSMMDRVLTALRRFLRGLLPDLAFSQAEARALLARAARAVVKPGPKGPGGGQFSVAEAPAIVDRLEQAITKGPATLVEKMRTTALHDWRPTWLGALMLRHLGELSKGTLGGVGSYVDRVQRMATDRNVMQEEADDLAERWRKWAQKNRREGAELAAWRERVKLPAAVAVSCSCPTSPTKLPTVTLALVLPSSGLSATTVPTACSALGVIDAVVFAVLWPRL